MRTRLFFFILFATVQFSVTAQDFSNKGTDFWVGYGSHVSMYSTGSATNSQNLVLYFTSDEVCNVKVEIPGTGWVRTYKVNPNSVTESEAIPKSGVDDARLKDEGVSNKGIHITSDKPVVAYSHIYDGAISGATLLFPTSTLGKDYYTLSYTQTSNGSNSYSFAFVIATEDNTVIEVTPSANTLTKAAGVTFTQTLQKGQVYNLLGQLTGGSSSNFTGADLTGTRIRSISTGNSGCKKIAVYCGSGKINIRCNMSNGAEGSADNIFQQCFPSNAWGKKYITIPTRDMPNNFFRIMVNGAGTVVKVNGNVLTGLVAGRFYEIQSNTPNIIEADNPVMVAQYITTTSQCNNNSIGLNGDPEMIYLSPVEQTISKVTLNSTTHANISASYHYINIVMKTVAIGSMKFDGNNIAANFSPLPGDPSFSYTQYITTPGIHNLQADSGFNAIAYGYGTRESYGYNAGTNVKDLYQFVALQNEFATVSEPATCKNTPFNFSITLPYKPVALSWDFANNPVLSPNATVVNNNPIEDSSYIKDGKTLYVYRLKNTYNFSATGNYQIKVIANNQTSDGCSGVQEIFYDVLVTEQPRIDFSVLNNGCVGDSVRLIDSSDGFGRTIVKWQWDFGNGVNAATKNTAVKYNTPATYNVKLKAFTDVGCFGEKTKAIEVSAQPVANFAVSSKLCEGAVVTFTDQSTISIGSINKWTWNFGEGNPVVSSTNNAVTHVYNKAGKYIVSLMVEAEGGCKSLLYSREIEIYANPNADFTFLESCVPSSQVQYTNTSTNNEPTSALSFLWNLGDGATATTKDVSHLYTSGGPFNIQLIATSATGCSSTVTKSVKVDGAPTAKFSIVNSNNLCSNAAVQLVNQSTSSFGSISSLEIVWDFVNAPSNVQVDKASTLNKIYTHNYPVLAAGQAYTIKVRAYTTSNCMSEQTTAIIVHGSPKVSFAALPVLCDGANAITFTQATESTGLGGKGVYSGMGVSPSPVFSPAISGVGVFPIKYLYVTDDGCRDSATQTITVEAYPKVNAGPDVVVLEGGMITLNPQISGVNLKYQWSPVTYLNNATVKNPTTAPAADIKYVITATSIAGCSSSDDVLVTVLKNPEIPNVFSPNNDGINDVWNIGYLNSYPGSTVEVYNRYGQILYKSVGYNKPWDGTLNGNPLPGGVYYYIINPKNGRAQFTGSVTIIR